uniref:Uncharacterized protein n=1 Tax=Pristionchus pacificus TaxID=54126 RepID=A0A2A6BM77_PRIPA|eukprot:PDM66948.1 hypothetical protein PRIPAC_48365 [Pristionchus pacificus]
MNLQQDNLAVYHLPSIAAADAAAGCGGAAGGVCDSALKVQINSLLPSFVGVVGKPEAAYPPAAAAAEVAGGANAEVDEGGERPAGDDCGCCGGAARWSRAQLLQLLLRVLQAAGAAARTTAPAADRYP